MAIKNVVAQDEGAGVAADELAPDDERLCQAIRAGLHRVLDVHAPLVAVPQQVDKARRVLRRADQQDLTDAAEHQGGQRVIDHGLVVDRHELLAHRLGHGVEPGAGAAGEDDALAAGEGRAGGGGGDRAHRKGEAGRGIRSSRPAARARSGWR